ncbi:MAG TPA: serine hydrolase, partial [Acidimicrobiia bacterium]
MRRLLVVPTGLVILAACAAGLQVGSTVDAGFPEQLAAELTEGLAGSWAEGFQVAVVLEDGSTWTYQEEPGSTDPHKTDIGSIGKTMEAALVLQLGEDGALDLDSDVDRWIEAPPGVTVRQLLQHTSGIASDDRNLPPVCDPGTCQSYSNAGYEMLGESVAGATGESNEENLRVQVIEPAGLTETILEPEEVLATAQQLAQFAHVLYRGELLEPESLDEMLGFESVLDLPGSNECETMGLGTVRRHIDGLGESWGHGGWTSVSRSWMEHFPESGVSFAVIVNGGADFLPLGPIYAALDAYLPDSTTPERCDHDVAELVDAEETLITERSGYDGQPAVSPNGTSLAMLSVFEDGIDIVLRELSTGNEARLEMEGWDVAPRWAPDGRLIYSSDIDGDREVYVTEIGSEAPERLTDNDGE